MLKTIVFQEIKKYASIIALDHHLVDPISNDTYFLTKKTSTVSLAHSLNMTVFYYFLSNEFNAYAFDYRSDPILQINSVISNYNVDGFITDFPATLYNFLHSKCLVTLPGMRVHLVDIEADVPNLVTYVNWTLVFECYVLRCGSKNRYEKGTVCLKWIGTTCSQYDRHSRLNSQRNWGNLYDDLMSMRIFTLITNKMFI